MADEQFTSEPAPGVRRRTKVAVVLVAIAAVAAAVTVIGYAFGLGPFADEGAGPVIARVDGRPIYLEEAAARVEGFSSIHGGIQEAFGPDWHDRVFQSLVDDQIIREEAARLGIVASELEISSHLQRLEGMFSSSAEFQRWLDSQHMTVGELERRIELQTLAARVYESVTANAEVSVDEIKAYYRQHQGELAQVDGEPPPLSQVRGEIQRQLEKEKKDQAYAAWLEGRRQTVNVVVVVDDWWRDIV